jgi:DNA-binding MarR family transcriptional regulator
MNDRQIFFTPEGEYRPRLKPLSKNQKSILSLLNAGLLQAGVAQRLRCSRPYVNQIVKSLESIGLISRRKPTYFYNLSPEAKSLLAGTQALDEFTPARLHNFKRKYRITSVTKEPSLDPRANFQNSWKMRGPLRHKYWYSGDAGIPSVTVDYHIKSLVIYIDRGQNLLARSVEEAEALGWLAIQKARDAWIKDQHNFGVDYAVEDIGVQVSKIHAGYALMDADPIVKEVLDNGGKVGYADYWIDHSNEKDLGPGFCEAETAEPENMTRLGRGIQTLETIQPEMFAELAKLGPLTSEVHSVLAHVQSGMSVQNQVNQLTMMLAKFLENQNTILDALDFKK